MNTTLERPPLGFTGVLTATKLYGNNWLPEKPIHYQGLWQRFTIPALFITDFASVPRILAWLVIRIGKGARAVILHDYLWRILVPLGTLTYRQADAILRQALREGDADKTLNDTAGDRVPFIQRWLMWTAVRWGALTRPGGRKHWWKDAPLVLLITITFGPIIIVPTLAVAIALGVIQLAEYAAWPLLKLAEHHKTKPKRTNHPSIGTKT